MATSRSLTQFARRMVVRSKQVVGGTTKLVQSAALVTDQVAVIATPVDTGFARAGWFPSIGTPSDALPSGEPGAAQAAAESIGRAQLLIPTWKSGDPPIFITNNVEYIGQLDAGSSAQAPAGMTAQAVKAGQQILKFGKVFNG